MSANNDEAPLVTGILEPAQAHHRAPVRASITTAVFVELCCGSAGLAAEMHTLGCDSLGVDFDRNPSKPKSAVLLADLSTEEGQSLVLDILEHSNVQAMHAAPPCGTASRAREKKLSEKLIRDGAPAPRQLRSEQFPRGLPNPFPPFTDNEVTRISRANAIYDFVGSLFLRLHRLGISWSLENPATSYFWLIPAIVVLLGQPNVFLAKFQQCCHGGARPVWRIWATNMRDMLNLNASCDNSHKHEPFAIQKSIDGIWHFDTSKEAAYPKLLCVRAARIIHDSIIGKGYLPLPTNISEADSHPEAKRQKRRASVGLFVRGNKLPPIVTDFQSFVEVCLPQGRVGEVVMMNDGTSAKILRLVTRAIGGSTNLEKVDVKLDSTNTANDYIVGVFRTPQQFAAEASKLRHPIDLESSLPDIVKRNIFWILTSTPLQRAKHRLDRLISLKKLVADTGKADEALFDKMCPETRKVLKGKKLSALRILLQQADYPDVGIVDEIAEGFPLTGVCRKSGVFPHKLRPATITVTQLKRGSKYTRKGLLAKVSSSGDPEIDSTIWQETMSELDQGWLSGPFSEDELANRFNEEFVLSRRFGIRQKNKIRCIDDFSESLVNSAISTFDKIELMGVDDFVSTIKVMAESIQNQVVSIKLSDGSMLKGRLPEGVNASQAKEWFGKTYDLKSAYRQLATKKTEQWATVVAVYCPELGKAQIFVQHALPFGAVGSVFYFNRASRALWAALTYFLQVVITCFYDDFSAAEPSNSCDTCDLAIKSFFSILGWKLALEPRKNKVFASVFDMLGVCPDMRKLPEDLLLIDNKPDRVSEVSAQIDSTLKLVRCSAPAVAELKGKCQFAANQFYGRVALGPLHHMSRQQFRCHSGIMSSSFKKSLCDFRELLNAGLPRQLAFKGEQRPVLLFSDGACEGNEREAVTSGAVCLDTVTGKSVMFGSTVPEELVKFWKSTGNIQTIGQAELLPVLLGRIVFAEMMRHRRVFVFIDNDSARQGLLKGYSDSFSSELMIRELVRIESKSQSWVWYARVPSISNPADGPSRLRLEPHAENLFSTLIPAPPVPKECFQPH